MIRKKSINFENYSVAILAGGRGTRVQNLFPNVPKPLIKIAGKQVLFRQIDFFLKYGIKKIFVLAGYMGEIIKEQIELNYEQYVEVVIEKMPLDTSGCLSLIKDKINTKYFVLVNGDLVFDIDFERFCDFHQGKNSECTLTVHSNFHPMDADHISYDENTKKVKKIFLRPHTYDEYYLNNVNAAISIINKNLLFYIKENCPQNFERDFIPSILSKNIDVYAYKSIEYIRDMGTPERLNNVEIELADYLPEKLKFSRKKKSILFDMVVFEKLISIKDLDKNNKIVSDIKNLSRLNLILTGFSPRNFVERKIVETFLGNNSIKLDIVFEYNMNFNEELVCFLDDFNISEVSYYTIQLQDIK